MSNEKTKENKSVVIEKDFNELLAETEAKLTQKDYYQTEKIRVKNTIISIHFKPLSQATFARMTKQKEDEKVPYLLTKTLYNPTKEKLFTKEELNALFEGLGGLTLTIASKIVQESGFDSEIVQKEQINF